MNTCDYSDYLELGSFVNLLRLSWHFELFTSPLFRDLRPYVLVGDGFRGVQTARPGFIKQFDQTMITLTNEANILFAIL